MLSFNRPLLLQPACSRQQSVRHASVRSMFDIASQLRGRGYILLVIPATCLGLGVWQVKRWRWKLGLIDMLEEKTRAPPIPFPQNLDDLNDLEYRKVIVKGTFDHSREAHLVPRFLIKPEGHKGHAFGGGQPTCGTNVVTALKLADRNLRILVNRGWVSRIQRNPERRMEGQIPGEVEFVAVVRHTEKRAPFTPPNNPKLGEFFHRDAEGLGHYLRAAPILVEADSSSTVPGGPIGGQTKISLRNEHLSYIFTWFTLSAATTFMWYKMYWKL